MASDHAHQAGGAEPAVDLVDAVALELTRHQIGGEALLEAELGVRVQFAADRGQVRVPRAQAGERGMIGEVHGGGDRGRERGGGRGDQWPAVDRSIRNRGSTTKYSRSTTRLMVTKISAIRHR